MYSVCRQPVNIGFNVKFIILTLKQANYEKKSIYSESVSSRTDDIYRMYGMVLNQIMPIKPDIRLNFRNMIFRNMC